VAVDGDSAAVRGVMTLDAETGLALALSRKFAELPGGTIWVKSELGVGSTFTFRIPS